jgi:hypothetical protein
MSQEGFESAEMEKSESVANSKAEDAAADGDVEKQVEGETHELADPFLVTWKGDDDPELPLNYSLKRKLVVTTMIAALAFLTSPPFSPILM